MDKTKVLVLEDSSERAAQFLSNNPDCEIVIVDTADKAIRQLIDRRFDIVCLDHDLGGKVYQPSDANSGMHVARFLKTFPAHKPTLVIVYSLNTPAAERMLAVLPGAMYIPFVWTKPLS